MADLSLAPSFNVSNFIHEPLADASKEIRLLRFTDESHVARPLHCMNTRQFRRAVTCSITTWSFADAPPYVAASYTWGLPEDTCCIPINGKSLIIPRSAAKALGQIRNQTLTPYVWIDSICINQHDPHEKSHQVWKMGKIFANAETVYACVGEHADGSEAFLAVVKKVAVAVRAQPGHVESWHLAWDRLVELRRPHISKDTPNGDVDKGFSEAYAAFGKRAYWRRVWIIQEIHLARQCLVLCGNDSISINDLTGLVGSRHRKLNFSYNWSFCDMMKVLGETTSETLHTGVMRREPLGVLEALDRFRDWQCTDPRDRLYALLELMAWPVQHKRPLPDYSSSRLDIVIAIVGKWQEPYLDFCSELAKELVDAFRLTVEDEEVVRVLSRREVTTPADGPPLNPEALHAIFLQKYPVIGARILRSSDGKLTLDLVGDDHIPYRPTYYPRDVSCPSLVGQNLWLDGLVIGHATPLARPGDIIVSPIPCRWIILRQHLSSDVYEMIGWAFSLGKFEEISHQLVESIWDRRDPASELMVFDLWFDSEDLVVLKILGEVFDDPLANRDKFLGSRVARDRFSSYAVRRSSGGVGADDDEKEEVVEGLNRIQTIADKVGISLFGPDRRDPSCGDPDVWLDFFDDGVLRFLRPA